MEENETANPMDVSILRTPAVMPDPNRSTYLVEQSRCGHMRASVLRLFFPLGSLTGTQVLGSVEGELIMEPNCSVYNGAFRLPNCS